VDSFLVYLDVERPVLIEVATEVSGSELDDGLGHSLGPAHARSLHAVLNQVLAGTFHRTGGDGQALGQILVIAHATAVAIEVVGHTRQRLALAAPEREFGNRLTNALHDLADVPLQDLLGTEANPLLGFRAAFGMEHLGGFPEFLQHVEQVEDKSDLEFLADENLLARSPSVRATWILWPCG